MDVEQEQFPARLEGEGVEHETLRSGTSPTQMLLKESLRSWHWSGYKQVFDLLAVVCTTDRQYDKVHKAVMDIAAEQERSMHVLVKRLWPQPNAKAETKERKA